VKPNFGDRHLNSVFDLPVNAKAEPGIKVPVTEIHAMFSMNSYEFLNQLGMATE
jgi:hypothetical protein